MEQRSMGRSCGPCTACCKPYTIEEIGKRDANWCPHCAVGQGCTIYEQRPLVCRKYACVWLNGKGEEDDRPDRLGVVVDIQDIKIGTRDLGLFHLWEIEEGALEKPRVKQLAESAHQQGFMVGYHALTPDTNYNNTFVGVRGILNDAEIPLFQEWVVKKYR